MNEFKPAPLPNDTALLLKGFLHDLNNLFICILSNIGLAQSSIKNETELQGSLEIAKLATMKATELASFMMRTCAWGPIDKEQCNLLDLVSDTIRVAQATTEVPIKFHHGDNPCPVCIDASAMTAVILNLLLNAGHATHCGGTIEVLCEVIEGPSVDTPSVGSRYAQISVKDEGIGMSPENIEQMTDQPIHRTKKEHGIGLAMVKHILEKHDGTLAISSVLDKGTCVTVRLPIAEFVGKTIGQTNSIEVRELTEA